MSRTNNKYILCIIDYFIKLMELFAIQSAEAKTVAKCLFTFICRHGIPEEVLTDQKTNYQSALIEELWNLMYVKRLRTSPFPLQNDGISERLKRTVKRMITCYVNEDHDDWDQQIEVLGRGGKPVRENRFETGSKENRFEDGTGFENRFEDGTGFENRFEDGTSFENRFEDGTGFENRFEDETGLVNRFEDETWLVNRFEDGTGLIKIKKIATGFLVLVIVFRPLEIVGRWEFFFIGFGSKRLLVNKHIELP
ncbi:Retrovirus-related Pol poly from transposon [Brachionus plicatilis]|uniref:Retrovirus-related Pol poly from transposon n=1 Tax=Brachionus plicatilis TaxID=10195 RepID=A0A3M7PSJ3_BRAPC|nr:Retrovirus-related Pol poly from transposon [Brachionus plicatilis]